FQKKQPDDDSAPSTSNSQSDLFSEETTSDNSNTSITTPTLSPSQQSLPTELNVTSPSKEEYPPTSLKSFISKQFRIFREKRELWLLDLSEVTFRTVCGAKSILCSPSPTQRRQRQAELLSVKQGIYQYSNLANSQSENEASPVKRPRLLESTERPEESSRSKQKSRRRCFQCQTKLELVQQELGSCRCGCLHSRSAAAAQYVSGLQSPEPGLWLHLTGYVFCMLHRLPEQHDCTFDHMGRGREEAIMKMVKLDRKVGRSCQRIGEGCS
ncbi:hypothetical protein A6R68_07078, partial [Neotoma lepida]